jgi:outer membrane protein assembly factor BamB
VDGGLVEVELEDEDASPAVSRGPRTPRRRWSARAWSRCALGLAVVLAAGAGWDGTGAARLLAAPGPGLVADLRAVRVALWRAAASQVLGAVGETVLLASADGATVQARDLADGRVRWSLPAAGCRLADLSAPDGRPSGTVRPRDARLLCEHMPTTQTTTVTIADASDGAVLASFADGRESPRISAAGRVAVVVTPLATGSRQLSVYSLVTGERLWGAPLQVSSSDGWYVQDDALVLLDPPRAHDLDTGEAVDVPPAVVRTTGPMADGSLVRTTATDIRAEDAVPSVDVLEPADASAGTTGDALDAAVRWTARGVPLAPSSPPGTVLALGTRPGSMEVHDLANGAVLWRAARPPVLLGEAGGALVAVDLATTAAADGVAPDAGPGFVLLGLDTRTGDELWRRTDTGPGLLVTDGTRLAVPTADGVEVMDLRTGRDVSRWRTAAGRTDRARAGGGSASAVRDAAVATLTPLPGGRFAWADGTHVVVLGF